VRTALVRTLKHRKRHETVTMDSSRAPSVYVLEVAVVMGDAANPEPELNSEQM
jgi:hypothetical protein